MSFRRRCLLAFAILVFVPTAMWAVRGENPFLLDEAYPDDDLTVFHPWHEDHDLPHGVDPVSRDALAPYFEPGDHIWNLDASDPEEGRAVAHPHGKAACASGCAANAHPTPPLVKQEFQRLMALYAQEPMSEESEGLEHLLYYGRQTLLYLDRLGAQPLDEPREEFLLRQLRRLHVYVEMRVVDEHGVVRLWNKPARVPLDIRHGFSMENKSFPIYTEPTGTVKRVGLYHLWQRI